MKINEKIKKRGEERETRERGGRLLCKEWRASNVSSVLIQNGKVLNLMHDFNSRDFNLPCL